MKRGQRSTHTYLVHWVSKCNTCFHSNGEIWPALQLILDALPPMPGSSQPDELQVVCSRSRGHSPEILSREHCPITATENAAPTWWLQIYSLQPKRRTCSSGPTFAFFACCMVTYFCVSPERQAVPPILKHNPPPSNSCHVIKSLSLLPNNHRAWSFAECG